jgi:hypothetical protein
MSASKPTVKDITVEKPTQEQKEKCRQWPVWKCKPDSFDWAYTETETCLLEEGKVMVTDDENSVTIEKGDLVTFPEDLECRWNITEPVIKHYSFS